MAVAITSSQAPFWEGPFAHPDISQVGFQSLTLSDAGQFAQVCKAWNAAMQTPGPWLSLFDDEKIPRIEGRVDTAKEDLQFMLSHTYSARKMACLGKFVGIAPMISVKAFEMYKTAMDPYEPSEKLSDTFVFVVEPLAIYRDYDEALFNDLIANGDFDAAAPENEKPQENGLLIPYSLKNLKILAEHPLTRKGEGSIFRNKFPDILKQCSRISKAVKVTLMRKGVPEESRNLISSAQKDRLKEKGHAIVDLCTRGYFDLLEILNKDSCPDAEKPRWTFSLTLDVYKNRNDKYPVAIGGFSPDAGVYVHSRFDNAHEADGAAPVFPAEVLAIGHWKRPLIS